MPGCSVSPTLSVFSAPFLYLLYFLNLLYFPCLLCSVSSSKFRILQLLCLPLLRKLPGCVPTIPTMEPPRRAAVMAYTASLLLRTLPAIAQGNSVKPGQERIELDFSDWSDPVDGSGIRGPACYRRAVEAGRLPRPQESIVMTEHLRFQEQKAPQSRFSFQTPCTALGVYRRRESDEFLARRSLWIARVGKESRFHGDRYFDAGFGHRCEHLALLRRQRRAPQSATVPESRPAPRCLLEDGDVPGKLHLLSQFLRLAERQSLFRVPKRFPLRRVQHGWRRRARTRSYSHDFRGVFSRPRLAAAARPRFSRRRRSGGRRSGHHPRRRTLEAQIWIVAGRFGEEHHAERQVLHNHWSGSGPYHRTQSHRPVHSYRSVDRSYFPGPPHQHGHELHWPPEARRHHRAGPRGHESHRGKS